MQGVRRIGQRVPKLIAVAVASVLAIGGVRRNRQKAYGGVAVSGLDKQASGGGARGFVATIEDRSNDRGFVASVEDKSNDTGFRAAPPQRVPQADAAMPPPGELFTSPEVAAPDPHPSDDPAAET